MNSTTYSHKPVEKVTSDHGSLSFDLLGQLTHMSILSLAGVPRDWIFRSSGDMALGTGTFFLHVYRLVKSAGMEYSQALKLVAGITRAPSVKSFFLRFSAAISSGESERDFVRKVLRLRISWRGRKARRVPKAGKTSWLLCAVLS